MLVPLDCAHVHVLDELVVTSLRSRISLLIADDELVNPFGGSDPYVAGADESHWIPVNRRKVFAIHFISKSDFVGWVKGGLNWDGDFEGFALEVSIIRNSHEVQTLADKVRLLQLHSVQEQVSYENALVKRVA